MGTQSTIRTRFLIIPASLIIPIVLILLAHLLLLLPLPLVWRTAAALMLTGFLPAYLLVDWLSARLANPYPLYERLLYSMGVGYGIIVIVMLLLSYLPGGIAPWQTFIAFDLLLVLLFALRALSTGPPTPEHQEVFNSDAQQLHQHRQWIMAGLIILALFGGFFRFADLAYSEFQGDEAPFCLSMG